MSIEADGAVGSPVAKFLADKELAGVVAATGAEPGDLVLVVAGRRHVVNHVLGVLRLELGRPPVNEGGFHYRWVVDFPLFEGVGDDGRPLPAHHPFTMPHPDDLDRLESDPLSVRSLAYDLVLNGWELGSGSIRIHRRDVQQRVFSLLGILPDEAQARFGFLLDAFRHGLRPTAGLPSGSTGWWPCWRGRRTSARSSPSPRPRPAPTPSPTRSFVSQARRDSPRCKAGWRRDVRSLLPEDVRTRSEHMTMYVSDDESPVDGSATSPNPSGGTLQVLSPVGNVNSSRPFILARLWSAPHAGLSDLPFIRRVIGRIDDVPKMTAVLGGRLMFGSANRLEVMLGARGSNTRQPRERYSY